MSQQRPARPKSPRRPPPAKIGVSRSLPSARPPSSTTGSWTSYCGRSRGCWPRSAKLHPVASGRGWTRLIDRRGVPAGAAGGRSCGGSGSGSKPSTPGEFCRFWSGLPRSWERWRWFAGACLWPGRWLPAARSCGGSGCRPRWEAGLRWRWESSSNWIACGSGSGRRRPRLARSRRAARRASISPSIRPTRPWRENSPFPISPRPTRPCPPSRGLSRCLPDPLDPDC